MFSFLSSSSPLYLYPLNDDPQTRFNSNTKFYNVRMVLGELQKKKDELSEIAKRNHNENIENADQISLDGQKYIIISDLIAIINSEIANYNNQIAKYEIDEHKKDQFLLSVYLFCSILETIKSNVETLALFRDKKPAVVGIAYFGLLAGSGLLASAASFSWPAVFLSVYATDRLFGLGRYFSGTTSMPRSLSLMFNALDSLREIINDLKPYINSFLPAENSGKNYYDILNLPFGASILDVKKSYYNLVLQCHPDKLDKNLNHDEVISFTLKFVAITEAYEMLSDPEKKNKYDSQITNVTMVKPPFLVQRISRN